MLISFTGVWITLADAGAVRSAFLRNAYALPFLITIGWRDRSRRPRIIPLAVAIGCLEGVEIVLYHAAVEIAGVGLSTLLVNLQLVFVALGAHCFFGEAIGRRFWVGAAMVCAGLLSLGFEGRHVPGTLGGAALAVIAACFYAAYILGLHRVRRMNAGVSAYDILISVTPGILAVTAVAAIVQGSWIPPAGLRANLWLAVLAIGTPVTGWWLITSAVDTLRAVTISAVLLLQPVLAIVWGILLFGEGAQPSRVSGLLIVVTGIAVTIDTKPAAPPRG